MPSRRKGAGTRVHKAAPKTPAAPKDEPKPSMLLGELGQTGLQRYGGLVNEEWLQRLKGTNGLRFYREMTENDPIIHAILYAMAQFLRTVTLSVEPGGETPEDEQAAEYLESVPGDMSHTFAGFISEWMAVPVFGFAPFEVVLKHRNGDNVEPGLSSQYTDGKIGVRKLAIRSPETLERWIFDDHGEVLGFVQRAAPRWDHVTIPIQRALLFSTSVHKGNPEGRSLLRGAAIPYIYKKKLEGLEAIGIERNMAGFPLLYYPPEWQSDSAYAAELAEVKKIVQRVKVDEQAGLALPMVLSSDGQHQLLKFELVATSGKTGTEVSPIIERYARYMAMSVLADVILLGHEKVGSFALSSSKTNLFAAGLGALKDDIESTLNRHLVPRLMRLNGFKVKKHPQWRLSDLETVDLAEVGAYIQQLSAAGFPLFPSENDELEKELMRFANLPVPEKFPRPTLVQGGIDEPVLQEFDADGNALPAQDTSNLPASGIDGDPDGY